MLKALREDGFKVTLFERRSQVGGLWAYSDDKNVTSALPSEFFLAAELSRMILSATQVRKAVLTNKTATRANISKYTCGFSDFPMPESK